MSTKTMRPPPRRVLTASSSMSSACSSFHTNPNVTADDKNVNSNININISHKRKERGDGFPIDRIKSKPSTVLAAATDTASRVFKRKAPNLVGSKPGPKKIPDSGQPNNTSNQLLLAGYLAHEFLSKGTMFGQACDPTRSEPKHCNLSETVSSERWCAEKRGYTDGEEGKPNPLTAPVEQQQEKDLLEDEEGCGRYREVANLLMSGGTHVPGIVNPSQLGRFLQL